MTAENADPEVTAPEAPAPSHPGPGGEPPAVEPPPTDPDTSRRRFETGEEADTPPSPATAPEDDDGEAG